MSTDGPTTDHSKGVFRVIVFVFLITQVVAILGVYDLVTTLSSSYQRTQTAGFTDSKQPFLRLLFDISASGSAFTYSRQKALLALGQLLIAGLALAATVMANSKPRQARSILSAVLIVLVGFTLSQASLRSFGDSEWSHSGIYQEWVTNCFQLHASTPPLSRGLANLEVDPESPLDSQLEQARDDLNACLTSWNTDRSSISAHFLPPGLFRQWFWVIVQILLYAPIIGYLYLGDDNFSHADMSVEEIAEQ